MQCVIPPGSDGHAMIVTQGSLKQYSAVAKADIDDLCGGRINFIHEKNVKQYAVSSYTKFFFSRVLFRYISVRSNCRARQCFLFQN